MNVDANMSPESVLARHGLPNSALNGLLRTLASASDLLMGYYNNREHLQVERKDDRSPVTAADHAAHDLLIQCLTALTPEIPVLSEESPAEAMDRRRQWSRYWLVDPLDGTKEFLDETGEFTVNLALIVDQRPVAGWIAVPTEQRCFLGIPDAGAWIATGTDFADLTALVPESAYVGGKPLRLIASVRHNPDRVEAMMAPLRTVSTQVSRVNAGSALKFCALAEGRAEVYPRTSPCYEWDVAAGDALVHGVGGSLVGADGLPFVYNDRDSLLVNFFVAGVATDTPWYALINSDESLASRGRKE